MPLPTTEPRTSGRRRGWSLVVVALLVVGTLTALLSAEAAYDSASRASTQALRTEATSIAAALSSDLHRDQDYMATEGTLFGEFPGLDNRAYRQWSAGVNRSSRYPGGLGFAFVESVPAAHLHAFAEQLAADPPKGFKATPASKFKPIPPGRRSRYCLARLAYAEVGLGLNSVTGFDFCASIPGVKLPFRQALGEAEDHASLVVAPPIYLFPNMFFLVEPVYRGDEVPAGVAGRERDLAGWALGNFDGASMLASTLKGVHGFRVALDYQPSGSAPVVIARSGRFRGGSSQLRTILSGTEGRWLVRVAGSAGQGAVVQALIVGLLVLGLSLLLALVIFLLARSRARALGLVDERTGELRHLALHDALTGLPNRVLILDRAGQMVARAAREAVAIGVLFIDLDNFKDINDTFGHQHGDDLLCAVADRLSAAVRASDSVGRLGGDEFVVLVEDHSLDAGPEVVAERVLEVLSEPFRLQGLEDSPLSVMASIGIAVGLRESADELLRDADIALYQAKQAGKARYVVFRDEMQQAVLERLALERDLRQAVEQRQLYVEYQPIFDLSSLELTGVEALARWTHPVRGSVGPDQFIPLAEATGLIGDIGRFVLAEACRQAGAWRDAGHPVPLSVNVSGRQLDSDQLPADVAGALASSGLEAGMLTLELTESVLMRDGEATVARLRALKRLGVSIAVDDFGTGYSSLAYVRQFPVDLLKIDRSFVATLARSPEARAVVRTLVQLGKSLGLRTVAEGIEDADQLAELQRDACDHGQGFYYARPLSASAVTELLADEGRPGHRSPSEASLAALQRDGSSTEAATGELRRT